MAGTLPARRDDRKDGVHAARTPENDDELLVNPAVGYMQQVPKLPHGPGSLDGRRPLPSNPPGDEVGVPVDRKSGRGTTEDRPTDAGVPDVPDASPPDEPVHEEEEAKDWTLPILTKSFIARMGSEQSHADYDDGRWQVSTATKKALGFEDYNMIRTHAFMLMLQTDDLFSEDPKDGEKASGEYRLWSKKVINLTCKDGKIIRWSHLPLEIAGGTEEVPGYGKVDSTVEVTDDRVRKKGEVILFDYRMKGRPNKLVEPVFQAVMRRECSWIWHRVKGKAYCENDTGKVKAVVVGSGFPSHRMWFAKELKKSEPQKKFEWLWICHPHESGLIASVTRADSLGRGPLAVATPTR